MLGHDLTAALPDLRAHAESMMLDTGKALRPTGERIYDKILQREVEQFDDSFGFTSRCKVQDGGLSAAEAEVGGRTSTETRPKLHLPASTPPLSVDDIWEMTTVHPLSLEVVGTRYRIVAPAHGGLKTARRYEVEVTQS